MPYKLVLLYKVFQVMFYDVMLGNEMLMAIACGMTRGCVCEVV